MALLAKETLQVDALTVVADTGYQNGEHALHCEANDITPIVPAPAVVNTTGDFFSKAAFTYEAEQDQYGGRAARRAPAKSRADRRDGSAVVQDKRHVNYF